MQRKPGDKNCMQRKQTRRGEKVPKLAYLHYIRSARSSVRRAVSSQPRHGSVMDWP